MTKRIGIKIMSKKLLFIINPRSGKNKNKNIFSSIEHILSEHDYEVDTIFTASRGNATELAEKSIGYDRVVCMGGDGTLNEVCNGLMRITSAERPTLGYVPAGSTNDFAVGIGLPKSLNKVAKIAASENLNPIDIGLFTDDQGNQRYFSYVASFGMFTNLSYSTNQDIKNRFGHMAYIFEGIKSIADMQNFRPFRLRVQTAESIIEQDYIFGAITNSTSLGGLMKLDKKHVHVNDGLFELLLIRKPTNFLALTDTVTQLLNHKYKFERIIFTHTDNVTLTSEVPLDWTLDGEYAGSTTVANISVQTLALNFARQTHVRKKPFMRKKLP